MTYQRYVRLGLIVFSVVLLMIILVKAQDNSTNKSQGTSAKSPDQLFDQGMYADALKGYEALYTTAKGDEQWKALYRMIECKGMLFRWGEALQMIVDMKMPEVNGIDATLGIKAINPSVPVIAITAYAMVGDEKRILEAGCDSYISKPLNRKVLLDKIAEFIKI